jgi:hypothetical protein
MQGLYGSQNQKSLDTIPKHKVVITVIYIFLCDTFFSLFAIAVFVFVVFTLCIGLICDNCMLALLSTTSELCVDMYLVRARHQLTTKLNVSYTLLIKGGKFWKVHNL